MTFGQILWCCMENNLNMFLANAEALKLVLGCFIISLKGQYSEI